MSQKIKSWIKISANNPRLEGLRYTPKITPLQFREESLVLAQEKKWEQNSYFLTLLCPWGKIEWQYMLVRERHFLEFLWLEMYHVLMIEKGNPIKWMTVLQKLMSWLHWWVNVSVLNVSACRRFLDAPYVVQARQYRNNRTEES